MNVKRAVVMLSNAARRSELDSTIFHCLSESFVFYKQYNESLVNFGGIDSVVEAISNSDFLITDSVSSNPVVYQAIGAAQALSKDVIVVSAQEKRIPRGRFSKKIKNILYDVHSPEWKTFVTDAINKCIAEQTEDITNAGVLEEEVIEWGAIDRLSMKRMTNGVIKYLNLKIVGRPSLINRFAPLGLYHGLYSPSGSASLIRWLVFYSTADNLNLSSEAINLDLIVEKEGIDKNPETEVRVLVVNQTLNSEVDRKNLARRLKSTKARVTKVMVAGRQELSRLLKNEPSFENIFLSISQGNNSNKYEMHRIRQALFALNKEYEDYKFQVESNLESAQRIERQDLWQNISFTAAHKLGNPLYSIETYSKTLELLLKEYDSDDVTESISGLLESTERAKYILGQFTSLTKAHSIEKESYTMNRLAEKFSIAFNRSEKLIEVCYDCPEVDIHLDPNKMMDCIEELVSNAKRYARLEPGCIKVICEFEDGQSGKNLVIRVKDNGSGITKADKGKIFDPFYSTREEGTGLGLSFVKATIDNHGGKIEEVGIEGEGAEFVINLPVYSGEGSK